MWQEAARRLLNRSYHFQVRKVASLLARPLRSKERRHPQGEDTHRHTSFDPRPYHRRYIAGRKRLSAREPLLAELVAHSSRQLLAARISWPGVLYHLAALGNTLWASRAVLSGLWCRHLHRPGMVEDSHHGRCSALHSVSGDLPSPHLLVCTGIECGDPGGAVVGALAPRQHGRLLEEQAARPLFDAATCSMV